MNKKKLNLSTVTLF